MLTTQKRLRLGPQISQKSAWANYSKIKVQLKQKKEGKSWIGGAKYAAKEYISPPSKISGVAFHIFRINMSQAGFEPGVCRVTVFEDCEVTALTTQPLRLDKEAKTVLMRHNKLLFWMPRVCLAEIKDIKLSRGEICLANFIPPVIGASQGCCVFWPANGCSARRLLVKIDFLMLKQLFLSLTEQNKHKIKRKPQFWRKKRLLKQLWQPKLQTFLKWFLVLVSVTDGRTDRQILWHHIRGYADFSFS